MRQFNPEQYVGASAFDLSGVSIDEGVGTRCIDGREERRWGDFGAEKLPAVAIPGAGVGFVTDVMSGINLLRRRSGKRLEVSPKVAAAVAESVLGEMSYHTDKHNEKNELPCAGCGYLAASLQDPEGFILSPEQASFVKGEYFRRLREADVLPVVYRGEHVEAALMVVDGLDIGLPATAEGRHVYVYNRGFHEELLRRAAREFLPHLETLAPEFAVADVEDAFLEAGRRKVERIGGLLAPGKPMYRVFRNETKQVLVESIGAIGLPADEEEESAVKS